MTTRDGLPLHALAEENLAAASPDLLRAMVKTFADALMPAEADALVAQGSEAGGHRGGFRDDAGLGLLSLLQLLTAHTDLPLVATGGIATGAAVAAVLAAGAEAAALGTAFLYCPEAGTAQVHRQALHQPGTTALTRAFTGRTARGIRNRFLDRHTTDAPAAYPEVHHLTAPLRQLGRARGEADLVNVWAGQTYPLARDVPVAELVRRIDAGCSAAGPRPWWSARRGSRPSERLR